MSPFESSWSRFSRRPTLPPPPAVGVSALPDSGADITVAGTDFFQLIGGHVINLLDSPERPRVADGRPIRALGMLPARLQLGNVTTSADIHFVQGATGLLLSWKAARGLQVLPALYPARILPDASGEWDRTPTTRRGADSSARSDTCRHECCAARGVPCRPTRNGTYSGASSATCSDKPSRPQRG